MEIIGNRRKKLFSNILIQHIKLKNLTRPLPKKGDAQLLQTECSKLDINFQGLVVHGNCV